MAGGEAAQGQFREDYYRWERQKAAEQERVSADAGRLGYRGGIAEELYRNMAGPGYQDEGVLEAKQGCGGINFGGGRAG